MPRATDRAGIDSTIHLRLLDSDMDGIENRIDRLDSATAKSIAELTVELRTSMKELSERQTRNLIVALGALMAFAGSVITAVIIQ